MRLCDCALLIFAKSPQPGKVKTRLSPLFDDDTCAAIHARLVRHILSIVCEGNQYAVELWGTPQIEDTFFQDCLQEYPITLKAQSQGTLGKRMHDALSDALARNRHVIVIGTDCPELSAETIHSAFAALQNQQDIVIVPATDGGYVLLGANRVDESLFAGIRWGTDTVLRTTLDRLEVLKWKYQLLPAHRDIDTPEDFYAALVDPITKSLLARFVP